MLKSLFLFWYIKNCVRIEIKQGGKAPKYTGEVDMIGWILTGGAVPVLLLFCGVFFIIYLRGYPLRAPRAMLSAMKRGNGTGHTPFRAVTEALAGTLGVGNIVGVANAIFIGGAGAVLWMWVSAILAMILKYAEILLAVAHRRQSLDGKNYGGAFYYIKDHFFSKGKPYTGFFLSGVFAALMILDALSMGCVIQVRAVVSAAENVGRLPAWGIALLLLLCTLPLLIRGKHGISALTEYLVPIMSAGYILLSVAVLILRRDAVGDALGSIFSSAFSVESASGGVLGFLTSRALRVGTMRGLLSNEAGCGTSPTAHAGADAFSPAAQGVWGIFEVFVDTILLCTMTALVILVSYSDVEMLGFDGMKMAIRAYSSVLGGASELFFAAAVFCFGYATLLCWGGYGMEAVSFLSKKRGWRVWYLFLFCVCTVAGACFDLPLVWEISDFAIAALTTVNLCVLFLMRREVRRETLENSIFLRK